jgi:hypothetical protein
MNLSTWGPLTVLLFILAIIFAGVGGVVVIEGHMSFHDYLDQLRWFGGVVAVAGIGKGLFNFGNVTNPAPPPTSTTDPATFPTE